MAIEIELVPFITPIVPAGADLRTHQRKFVQVTQGGILVADVRTSNITTNYVAATAPDSGQPGAIISGPNCPKVIAGEAIVIGGLVQVMSASGLAGACPVGSFTYAVGTALATAAGSGEYIPVKLWK
jgi:hypothetical protein